jgi:hypothetical protein
MPELTPPLDLAAIAAGYYYVHLFNAGAERPNIVEDLVARVWALEAEVAALERAVRVREIAYGMLANAQIPLSAEDIAAAQAFAAQHGFLADGP